mgnify:CR=1 FL=1
MIQSLGNRQTELVFLHVPVPNMDPQIKQVSERVSIEVYH